MGYQDRDYMRPGGMSQRPGSQQPGLQRPGIFYGAPVTKALIIANIVIFFLGVLMTPSDAPRFFDTPLDIWGMFSIEQGIFHFQIWRFLTFQFLHADFHHLLMNMIGMFFFGPHVERWMGSRPFIFYYLFCGIAGALFYVLLFFTPGVLDGYPFWQGMVGASAGIFGILAAFYKIAPNARILLMFFIPMKMRTFAIVFFIWEVVIVVFGLNNAGGSAGHLGGALLGLAFIKFQPMRSLLIKISSIGTGTKSKSKTKPAKVIRETQRSPIEVSKEVDRILEKISNEGIQSLTTKERETLDKARKK